MGRLLSLIYRAHGGEALAEFLFELRTGISPAEQQGSGWGELLWERASRLLAEQWEVWGEDEATAEQVGGGARRVRKAGRRREAFLACKQQQPGKTKQPGHLGWQTLARGIRAQEWQVQTWQLELRLC